MSTRAVALAMALVVVGGACQDDASTTATVPVTVATVAPTVVVTTVPVVAPPTTAAAPQLDVGAVLDGSSWELDAIIESEAAEAVPDTVRDPTISFEAGVVTVDTGCNTGSGSFTTTGDQITFEPIGLTRVGCDDVAANVERSIVDVLQATATVIFDNGILNIVRDGRQLVYLPN